MTKTKTAMAATTRAWASRPCFCQSRPVDDTRRRDGEYRRRNSKCPLGVSGQRRSVRSRFVKRDHSTRASIPIRLSLFVRLQQETIMNRRTAFLLLAICAAGVSATAHAQDADTGVL